MGVVSKGFLLQCKHNLLFNNLWKLEAFFFILSISLWRRQEGVWGVPVDTATALVFVYPKCESALGQNISKVFWLFFFFFSSNLSFRELCCRKWWIYEWKCWVCHMKEPASFFPVCVSSSVWRTACRTWLVLSAVLAEAYKTAIKTKKVFCCGSWQFHSIVEFILIDICVYLVFAFDGLYSSIV